jgi:hypothetical protein
MSALMLNPCFKSLQVLESFVRYGNTIHLVTKCDVKEAIFLLMIIFYQLNCIVEAIATLCDEPIF